MEVQLTNSLVHVCIVNYMYTRKEKNKEMNKHLQLTTALKA